MQDNVVVAQRFWQTKHQYPGYDHIKQRRYHEVSYVVKTIDFGPIDTLVDVGCGDGGFVKCIENLIDIRRICCFDWSAKLLDNIYNPKVEKHVLDCNDASKLAIIPSCDLLICGGLINYLFEDQKVVDLLAHFKAEHIFIRAPCVGSGNDMVINAYSQQLKEEYSCMYRTLDSVLDLIKQSGLNIISHCRIYPDQIESRFGTRQHMIYCSRG